MYWIEAPFPGRLATMARPRGGDWLSDEILRWRLAGVDLVVSLLEDEEIAELELREEEAFCRSEGIAFRVLPIVDRGVPISMATADALVGDIVNELAASRSVAIHCRAGIGRSSLIAACALVRGGLPSERAFELISKARGLEVSDTAEQRDWGAAFERHVKTSGQ